MIGSLVLYSMPEFWLGMLLLLLFSSTLGWFPVGGRISINASDLSGVGYALDVANHLFLPVLTLTLAYIGQFYLVMRSSLLDVLGEDYITTARAKGVSERQVLRHHAVRNALLPTVTLVALSFGYIIGGAITVEVVFSYQGPRAAHVHRDPGEGLLAPAGALPVLHARRDRLQPDLRLHLRLPRSAGSRGLADADPSLHVGAEAPLDRPWTRRSRNRSAGKPAPIRWARRRKAFHRFWLAFRKDTMGMVGLAILVFFIGVAIFAIFAGTSGTRTEATGERLQPPSWDYPLGTDNYGRSVLTLTIQGAKVSLLVGLTRPSSR